MSEIIALRPYKDPDIVLEKAKGQYSDVLVIGWDKHDELDIRSTDLNRAEVLELIEIFKHKLLEGEYDG